jgi:hypothetical protein
MKTNVYQAYDSILDTMCIVEYNPINEFPYTITYPYEVKIDSESIPNKVSIVPQLGTLYYDQSGYPIILDDDGEGVATILLLLGLDWNNFISLPVLYYGGTLKKGGINLCDVPFVSGQFQVDNVYWLEDGKLSRGSVILGKA